jgi:hypothetical protein
MRPRLGACRNAAAAGTALEKLLSGIMTDAGLVQHHSGFSSSSSSSKSLQTHQRPPADLQELLTHVAAACSRAGCAAQSPQKTAAELSSCLLEHYKQQQQQWPALPSVQVPSADALVAALNMAVYSQVGKHISCCYTLFSLSQPSYVTA